MIRSELFQAFWKGLSHRGLYWGSFMEGRLDLKGFFSAMSQSMVETLVSERTLGANYFIVARRYLNASFRFGYHFTTVDSYITHRAQDNYIVMTFKGGAAPEDRRRRRIRLVQRILQELGFEARSQGDFLRARYKYGPREESVEKLTQVALLIGATRMVDMVLFDDRQVDACVRRFFDGDYTLGLFNLTGAEGRTDRPGSAGRRKDQIKSQ